MRWLEEMETIVITSKFSEVEKIQYSALMFKGDVLEWWNALLMSKGRDVMYGLSWEDFKALLMAKFCPMHETDQIQTKFLNLKVVGTNLREYNTKFHEYCRLVPQLVHLESSKVTRYIWGLPREIRNMVRSRLPQTADSAMELAGYLMGGMVPNKEEEKKVTTSTTQGRTSGRNNRFKGKGVNQSRFNSNAPQCKICRRYHKGRCNFTSPPKEKTTRGAEAAMAMPWDELRELMTKQFCPPSELINLEAEFWNLKQESGKHAAYTSRFNELSVLLAPSPLYQVQTYQTQPAYQSQVPLLLANQAQVYPHPTIQAPAPQGGQNVQAAQAPQENRGCAFMINANQAQQNGDVPLLAKPRSKLKNSYSVEVANGKSVTIDLVIRNCKLNLNGHKFSIDLIPMQLESFDIIVGMDWLSVHRDEIVCFEKFIRIPLVDGQILRVSGEMPSSSSLNFITYFQAQIYLRKKYVALVAHVVEKKERKIKDIPVVREYPEVFPVDVSSLPPNHDVEFCIDLVPGATPIARMGRTSDKGKGKASSSSG
ncbi:uncharacterized protein LOC143567080 [Bidens hawaiensis]|uniref:uncharacterized protein LOC143567080 n=1 Tax=Bidens hawaiensis TaxID=980011 RepID=UPI004049C412